MENQYNRREVLGLVGAGAAVLGTYSLVKGDNPIVPLCIFGKISATGHELLDFTRGPEFIEG